MKRGGATIEVTRRLILLVSSVAILTGLLAWSS
jgi:hypothetical protein